MLMLVGFISVLIWVLIFLFCLLFRKKKLPYFIYLMCTFLLTYFFWDSYNYDANYYGPKVFTLLPMIGVFATLGLICLLIGEVTFDNLDNPWGGENQPKWPKYLAILMIIMCFIISISYLS